MVPGEDRLDEEAKLLRRVASGERIQHYETTRRRKDGTEIDVSLTLSPIVSDSGQVLGASSIARDVTLRKRTEAKFQGLVESAPDAIVAVDAGGVIRIVNRQARPFGYERRDLVGHPIEVLVPDRIRDIHPGHRTKYFAGPQNAPYGPRRALWGRAWSFPPRQGRHRVPL
jgi:PAS domain-containing protein